jgi:hypothetical protein
MIDARKDTAIRFAPSQMLVGALGGWVIGLCSYNAVMGQIHTPPPAVVAPPVEHLSDAEIERRQSVAEEANFDARQKEEKAHPVVVAAATPKPFSPTAGCTDMTGEMTMEKWQNCRPKIISNIMRQYGVTQEAAAAMTDQAAGQAAHDLSTSQ